MENLTSIADKFTKGDLSIRGIKQGNDEVGDLTESFNNLAETVEKNISEIKIKAEENERMSASLSHEIRNPLSTIKGYAQYMEMADLSDEEKSTALSYIISESNRLQSISKRMLQLYSLKDEFMELHDIYLPDVFHNVRLYADIASEDKGIVVDILPVPEVSILGDEVLLESLFTNLIDNGIKACKKGGNVNILFSVTGNIISIEIEDNGCGMSDKALSRLGEAFYRADTSRSRIDGGAGLGVSLCYRIVKVHKGNMTYSSILNKGTKVVIEFTVL